MPHYDEGIYDVVINDQGMSQAASGTPYAFFTFAPDGKFERQAKLYLTDKTAERTIDDLAKLGIAGLESFGQLNLHSPNAVSIVGKTVSMECRYETGKDNKVYERWDVPYTPKEKAAPVAVDTKAIRTLDSLFGKMLKAKFGRGAPAAKPEAVDAPEREVVEDDIPF